MQLQLTGQSFWRQQRQILADITLTVAAGEHLAIVGPSGVGKSSLLQLLYQHATQQVAWCPQQLGLVDSLSVFHNLHAGALEHYSKLRNIRNWFLPEAQLVAEYKALCQWLELPENCLRSPVAKLSGGQQQRVAIGRAVNRRASVFLGDEPVSALDQYQGEQLLRQVIARHQSSVIVLHDIDLALSCCNRVIGLKHGGIFLDRPSEDLLREDLATLYDHA